MPESKAIEEYRLITKAGHTIEPSSKYKSLIFCNNLEYDFLDILKAYQTDIKKS